ncbi:MAG: CARDB domain-containing protein [Ferruginibacter sp.]
MKTRILSYIIIACCFTACSSKQASHNFLFDMGSDTALIEKSFTRVSLKNNYTTEKGFGWIHAPSKYFDSINIKLPQTFLHEGVFSNDSIVFRADVPDGDYFASITLGTPGSDSAKMIVTINRETIPDTIFTPWYRLSYKTLCKKIHVNEKKADIKIVALTAAGAGLYAIELRPVADKKEIKFTTPLEEETAVISQFAFSLRQQLAKDSGNIAITNQLSNTNKYLLACYYYDGGGWSWAVKKTGMSLIYRMYAAADLLEQIIPDTNDPLYDKSLYLLAKVYYWLNEEDEVLYHSDVYKKYFSLLKNKYPGDSLLKMYTGEKLFDPPGFDTASSIAPRWALYEREAMHRMLKVIDWWVNKKQIANGEMGGKYGDDVELLRPWLAAILGADDSTAKAGYKKLADGIWNSDALERGFAKRIDDVEHSAELFRDTHPALFLMNYGNPEYVERCLISMQNFRDVWTGVTSLGHLHFKSYYLSATEALTDSAHGIDVALNARAILPGLWAGWYDKNPTIIKLFSAYSNAWVADAEREGNGKPAGLIPSTVAFDGDRIGGNSNEWWDAHLSYDYYLWDHVGHVCELQYHLLGMYDITKNTNFLKTINTYAALMIEADKEKDQIKNAKPGSLNWAKYLLISGGIDHEVNDNPMGKAYSMAQKITGSNKYDQLIAKYAEPYNRYQITHDSEEITKGFEEILGSLRYNFPMLTSEVKFTDRVYMPGSNLLTDMYTGHFGAGYEYPSLVATWKNTGPDVSVFVNSGDKKSADISLYNFEKEKTVQMLTWRLEPGLYSVKEGIDTNDDGVIDELLSDKKVELHERVNTIDLAINSKKIIVVSIRQINAFGELPANMPDVAIATNDISLSDTKSSPGDSLKVNCTIHNIGNIKAKNILVEFLIDNKKIREAHIPELDAPNDLTPKHKKISFNWLSQPGIHRLEIKLAIDQKEITTWNNDAFYDYNSNAKILNK